jgi:hypothetical protein
LAMMRSDQAPLYRRSFVHCSQVMICGVSSGCMGVSEHSVWSPMGSIMTLCALSDWHPLNSWIAVKGSDELLFWKKVPPLVKSIPKDSQSPMTLGMSDRRARVAPASVYEGMAKMCVRRCKQNQ